MMNHWLLPDHVADVLPTQARQIEEVRRALLDTANRYGFELVIPPLIEHLDSLLIGVGTSTQSSLNLQTFKLVDQHSGRSLGVRADTTSQVARIDAHLLNRQGLARLCYCGPVLHTRPTTPRASREPLQFGAEIYGHSGWEADLEVIELALASLAIGGVENPIIDFSDIRIATSLVASVNLNPYQQAAIYEALAQKDASALCAMTDLTQELRSTLTTLLGLYGNLGVLNQARKVLPQQPAITSALDGLELIAAHLMSIGVPRDSIRFDLAELGAYGYYTGIRFAIYSAGVQDALARGGRYDEFGHIFGRKRSAVGFSLDIKALVDALAPPMPKASIRMPWSDDPALRLAASALRSQGETVICFLPGHSPEATEFVCDRELILVGNQWIVNPL